MLRPNKGMTEGLQIFRQGHSSSLVQRGSALPMIALVGNTPKYRPSSEFADCQFMRKTSPSPTTRQPCQTGSGRPRLSRSRASPISILSTVMVRPSLQTVCPGSASTPLQHGNVARQIIPFREECREWFGRLDRDKFGDSKSAGRPQPVETDWHAFGSVPKILGDGSCPDRRQHNGRGPQRRQKCRQASPSWRDPPPVQPGLMARSRVRAVALR